MRSSNIKYIIFLRILLVCLLLCLNPLIKFTLCVCVPVRVCVCVCVKQKATARSASHVEQRT